MVGFSWSSTQTEWHDCRVNFLRQILSNVVDAFLITSLVHLRHVFSEALNFGQRLDAVVLRMAMTRISPPTESGTKLCKYAKIPCPVHRIVYRVRCASETQEYLYNKREPSQGIQHYREKHHSCTYNLRIFGIWMRPDSELVVE